MEFNPSYPEQLAGLTYMYDAMNFYVLGKTVNEAGEAVLTLIKSDQGVVTDEMEPVRIPASGAIRLRARVGEDGTQVTFYYDTGDDNWQQAGVPLTTEIMTDEHCRGFTGAHFGMYVHDMTGLSLTADFDYFSMPELYEKSVCTGISGIFDHGMCGNLCSPDPVSSIQHRSGLFPGNL